MKDYSCSFAIPKDYRIREREDYYLYYTKSKGKIIVHMPGGKKKEFLDTVEVEQELISKMEKQVEDYSDEYIDFFTEEADTRVKTVSPLIFVSSTVSLMNVDPNILFSTINYSALGVCTLLLSQASITHSISKSIKKDYEKHRLYLDNKKLINKYLRGDLRGLNGMKKKVIKEASENAKNNSDTININTMRLIKLKELKSIINKANNVKKYELKH